MKGKTEFKRSIAFIISFIMLITMMPFFAFGEASDLQGHWASDIIKEWMQDGLVNGYPDGSFRPDNPMTRAELMVLTNKVFEFSEQASISFKDVKEEDWFYTTIKQGIAAGYISGYPDNTIRPNNPISRQEAAIILARVMELPVETTGVKNFNDVSSIPSWSKGYISAVVSSGYMRGYPDGEFKPTEAITRAEVLVVLNNARIDIAEKDEKQKEFTRIFDKAGSYGSETGEEVFEGDVYIKTEGVTLQNMVIQGDLTITEEVGDGDVYLNNVTVEGDTHIQGGGKDSIYINDGSYNKVIIHKIRGGVRVISIGANITEIQVHSRTAGNEVILKGTFKDVFVLAGGINLITQENTTIEKLTIGNQAKNNNVTTSKETIINETIVNSKTEFKNEGTIKRATGTAARNSNYDVNQPDNFTTPSGGGGGGSSSPSTARVSAITVTPPAGKVAMGTKVTLSTATAGATIYYTLDDSTPTTSSNQYTDPITINSAITIKAIGVKSGMNNSSVATFSYTVEELAKPEMTVSPSQVTVDSDFNQTFTLSIANDTVVNTVYAKDHSLEGVFQGMSLGTVARTNNTTVTVAVYGNLANAGTGTITLDADALVDSESNLTVNVTVLEATVIPVGGITVTGNAVVGETLTATPNPSNAEGTYQWKRSNTSDGAYENIGIDSNIYEIAAGDEGKYIRVVFIASGNYTGNPTSNVIGPVTTVTAYEIGDTGPAGGIIFYDKGNDDDGWRYLEVSPVFTQWSDVSWGGYGTEIGGTADAIGTGALNTSYIVNWLYANGETGKAAQLAYELNVGGYDDWFLPSSNELIELSREISPDSDAGLEEFKNFWSSSEEDTHYVKNIAMWGSSFAGYYPSSMPKNGSTNARAIRAFSGEPSITIPVQSVSLTGADGQDTIAWGETLQMQEVIFPANATNQMVTWESSDEAIATVDGNGLMTALAAGTTDITVTTDDGDFKGTVTITVTTATTYSITIADVVGGTAEITTNAATEAAEGETVTVNISNIEGGKQFASIQVNGGDVTATEVTAGEEYTFVMPAEAVTVTVELESSLSSYAEILSYSLSDQIGDSDIDVQAATITVEVPYETDISNLVATFTTSENIQSIKVGEVEQESATTSNDFSSAVTYVVIAEDGTIKEWVVTVSVESNLDFDGGLGTEEDPYQIATAEHLDNVRKYLGSDHANTHFILLNDIDLGDATSTASGEYWNDGKGWEPIGTAENAFMGSLNGAGFSISDLYINRPEENDIGLFGVIQKNHSTLVYDPGIHNLALEGGSLTGKDYVGSIAGRFVGQMSSVTTNVTVHGERYVGGLIGRATSGSHWTGNAYTDYRQRIENCWAFGDVYGTQYVGGLLGSGGTRLTITNCHAAGDVTGITGAVSHIGGFIGIISGEGGTSVSNSYATGNVVAPSADRVGGLSGSASQNAVSNSYATGNVEGNEIVGGLIGSSSISVSGNFATGDVVGNSEVGGLVGYSTAHISNAYSSGNVSGNTKVGGLVGQIGWWPWNSYARTRDISDSYALGNVTGSGSDVGGLAGWMVGDVNNSYFTASVSGTTSNIGSMVGNHGRGTVDSSYYNQDNTQHGGGGIPKTTDEMKQETTYSGWNFSNTWGINALENQGYPFLRWQEYNHISNAAEILEFSFAEEAEPSVIDWKEGTISIKVGNGTDMTDLVATFFLSAGATATIVGTQQESGVTVNDFSSPVIYIVTAEDESTTKEWVVTVTEIDFAGGAGTEANPFEIATAEQLNNVRNYLGTNNANTHFIIINDIDLNDATSDGGNYWNDSKGWEPIGRNYSTAFRGVFDGGGFSISNIFINRSDEDYVGLFGYCAYGELNNVRIENADYNGKRYIGALSGYVSDGVIRDSSATGTIEGDQDVGGLVGYNTGSSVISHSNTNVTVKGKIDVGGLVGNNFGDTAVIESSYATGDVQGESRVGGLAGYNRYKINNSYATGKVAGERAVGGLVGHQVTQSGSVNSVITNSYALNPELFRTNGDYTTFGRVLGNLAGGNLSGNYANKDIIEPFEGGFNDKIFNGKDGRQHAFLYVEGDVQRPVGIAIDEQDGTLTEGMSGEITFQVTTNLDDEEVINVELKDGPIGLTTSNTTVNEGTTTITIMSTDQAVEGKYQFAINYQGQGEQIVDFEVATDELSPSNEAEILSYSLPNQIGDSVINSQAGTITVEVPYETDVSNLLATFTTSENTQSIKVGEVEQESGTTSNDFSSSVTYVVIAEDGTIKEWVVTVSVESNPDFDGGIGTEEDPYQIATAEHLDNVRKYLGSEHENTYFKLVDDIDLGVATSDGGAYWNDGKGWEPIGDANYSNYFMSTFDGGGFSISNLNIYRQDEDYVGLFGYIGSNAKIQNLNLTDATVEGQDYIGVLVGYNVGDIRDITVSGELFGNQFVGGLIGENRTYPTVNNTVSNVNVTGTERVGGLIGQNYGQYIKVENSSAHGKVIGSNRYIGGLVGFNGYWASVNQSHATGDVEGVSTVGGLVGYSHTGNLENSYASGDVTGASQIGGLIGLTYAGSPNRSYITNCFALGSVKGETEVGGIVGRVNSRSSITGNYALNPEIIRDNTDEISFGRIGNRYISRGYLSENYANKNMIEPFSGAFNDKTPSSKDGGDLTSFSFDNGVLTVERTGSITGTITDSEDSPIEGTTVSTTVNGVIFQATTIPDGTYTIWNIPAGAGITVTANMDGYQASSTEVTVEAGKQTGDADFTLSDE